MYSVRYFDIGSDSREIGLVGEDLLNAQSFQDSLEVQLLLDLELRELYLKTTIFVGRNTVTNIDVCVLDTAQHLLELLSRQAGPQLGQSESLLGQDDGEGECLVLVLQSQDLGLVRLSIKTVNLRLVQIFDLLGLPFRNMEVTLAGHVRSERGAPLGIQVDGIDQERNGIWKFSVYFLK